MTLLDVRSGSAPPACAGGSRGLVRWVCTSNPFYVLSALLVCLGLWVSFGAQGDAAQTWALLVGMAGYTLLLAVTACLLVRFVGVWDDVRTVLLLVVLMFLATSVTFDDVLARSPARGTACYLGGLLLSVAVSEGILRSIRLSLPPLFRAPYYAILALFFLYPVALTPLLDQPRSEALAWAMFGFSTAAGLVFLTLLPAIRRGRDYVCENGSPWGWAWYPWTLFGVLGFGVAARSALLCWSMHHLPQDLTEPYIFGPYFLVPFGLAIAALLLEIGLVEQRPGVLRIALGLPVILVLLTMAGQRTEPLYQWFLERFRARLGGTPLFLTLAASAGFYTYAAFRRAPRGLDALSGAMVVLAFVTPDTLDLDGLVPPQALPVLAAALVQTALGLGRRDAWRCLIGAGGLVASAMLARGPMGGASDQAPVSFHLILIAVLVVGAAFDNRLGRILRTTGAMMVLLGSLVAMMGPVDRIGTVPTWAVEVYPLVMSLMIAVYGFVLGHWTSLVSAGLILAGWLAALAGRGYGSLRHVVAGLDYIAIGLVLFILAVLTSMAKGGVLPWRIVDGSGKPAGSG